MTLRTVLLLGAVLWLCTSPTRIAAQGGATEAGMEAPFSLAELTRAGASPDEPLRELAASDGVELAYRRYCPVSAQAVLIFYHGGGAHSGAGYGHLARGLADDAGVVVYTPDLRGHGSSGGPRGDAPSVEQVLRDAATFVRHAREAHPELPVFLGGHSSGGGMALNYASWGERAAVDGYLLLSPQLGFRSGTGREGLESGFATVSTWAFAVNAISGGSLLGDYKAVVFRYPPEMLERDPGMVGWNTVNLANSITPSAPHDQFRGLDRPIGVWIGAEDELFEPEKVVAFVDLVEEPAPTNVAVVVPGESHIGILVNAHVLLGPWLEQHGGARTGD